MEYTYIFSIGAQVLGLLSSPIFQELTLAWGLSDDLHRLKNTISCVQAVLLDAQDRQTNNHQLKDWLEKLENAFYSAQNVLEEFEIYALRNKECDRTILKKVFREFSRSNRIVFHFKMARKIKKIRGEFNEIADDRNKFNLIERSEERFVGRKEMTHSFVNDGDVIGRDKEIKVVTNFLMDTTNDECISVLPIIGLGGMGKTMLAKMVYNDESVKAHFDLRIWVCIPEEFELEKVIEKILMSIGVKECDNLPLEQLQKKLRDRIVNRKYLLILDDVWTENHIKWMNLKDLLICGAKGSKVITTTRNQLVASIMATSDLMVKVEGLSSDKCLSIFLKWAFRSSKDVTKYPNLVKIARSIVEKCKGVPLAVRTLGIILYTKTDELEWINVRDNEIWKLEQKEGDIIPALKLSYFQLPSNLRRCFAICSIFPKDYTFWSNDLLLYWQANGFLQGAIGNQDVEEVGMVYIKQLLSRGFFQEFEDYGTIAAFKMHDLIHDLSLLVAGRDSITLNSLGAQDSFPTRVLRHVSFPKDYFSVKEIPSWLLQQKENLHTLCFPHGFGVSKNYFIEICISKFKTLRLLNLNCSTFEVLPNSIGSMKHLKYLNVSHNKELKSLPASICDLVGLEALFFDGCLNIKKLPRGIGKLIRIQRLGLCTKESYLPENDFRCLTSLKWLIITNSPNLKFIVSDAIMCCFSALRSLSIVRCESLVSLLVRGLSRLTRLEILEVDNCRNLNFTTDDDSDSHEIESVGKGEGLRNLQMLSISGLPMLESLPLCHLRGANNLKSIGILHCNNLTNLIPESTFDRLKLLQKLWIIDCPKLKSLPEGMCCLSALNEFGISYCPDLVSRCQRDIGEDWHKISHVPNIYLEGIKFENDSMK